MSTTVYTTCGNCGGVKGIVQYGSALPYYGGNFPVQIHTQLCTCKPAPKHDGNLDKDGWGNVVITEVWSCVQDKYVQGIRIGSLGCENESMRVELDPAQALSLLAWLLQEKEKLESLAKEQDGGE